MNDAMEEKMHLALELEEKGYDWIKEEIEAEA